MKKMIKYFIFIIALGLMVSLPNLKAAYNYDPNGNVISSAESLVVTQVIDSSNLSDELGNKVTSDIYQFGSLYDIAVYGERIFVVDYTNNVISVLNSNFQYVTKFPELSQYQAEIDACTTDEEKLELQNRYTLKNPRGIYVTKDYIYVCDYGKNRVVIFDHNLMYVREVGTPDDPAFSKYEFRPKKITVDRTGRMFVIAEGVNEGILDLEPSGEFSRFYGTNTVTISAWDAFWLLFTSEEQREIQGFNFGASLANLCIDEDNNVYTVSSISAGTNVIKKLNPKGSDILNRNGYVEQIGDPKIDTEGNVVTTDQSNFVDIDVNEYGTYIALDNTRGRIFAYDFEGSLLYTAGAKADLLPGSYQTGMFLAPEALTYFGDKILVCDSKNNNIVVFEYTTFGKLVNEATMLYYDDKYIEAAEVWEEVLALNTNYYIAYAGIGKAQLRQGDYKNAMENLKLGYDEYNYSRAYQQIRYEQMNVVFPYIISAVMILAIYGFVRSVIKSAKQDEAEEEGR